MCVIFTGSAREILAVDGLERAYQNNPDAWGVSWAAGGQVHVKKRGATGTHFNDAVKVLRKLGDAMVILHFRIATSGTKCERAAHPFILGNNEAAFAHNGIISKWGDAKDSDTMQLVKVLNALDKPHGPAARLLLHNLIEQGAGRFAVQSADGGVLMYGNWEELVKQEKGVSAGVFASNTYWKAGRFHRSGYGYGAGYEIGDSEYARRWEPTEYDLSHPMRNRQVVDRWKDSRSWSFPGSTAARDRYSVLPDGTERPPEGATPIDTFRMTEDGRGWQLHWLPTDERGVTTTAYFEVPMKVYWDAVEAKGYSWKARHDKEWGDRRVKVLRELWQADEDARKAKEASPASEEKKGAGAAGDPFTKTPDPASSSSHGSGGSPSDTTTSGSATTSSLPLLPAPAGTGPGSSPPSAMARDLLRDDEEATLIDDEFEIELTPEQERDLMEDMFCEDAEKAGLTPEQLASLGFTPEDCPLSEPDLIEAAEEYARKSCRPRPSVLN